MKEIPSIIQPEIQLVFGSVPNTGLSSPYVMHVYDAAKTSMKGLSVPSSLKIMPSANCVWIIAYNDSRHSHFACIGSQREITYVDIAGYKNYFIAVFADNAVLFNKGASDSLTPAHIAGRVIEFTPEDGCPEQLFIKDLLSAGSLSDKCSAFKKYLSSSKRAYAFSKAVDDMRSLIVNDEADTVEDISRLTGYSSRHITRLFTSSYGFGPKDYCKYIRFQKVLGELFSNPDRPNSDFIQNIGYSDQAHFQREFKSFVGETPKQFIKRMG